MKERRDRISIKYSHVIQAALKPLKAALGVNYFYYSRISNEGLYSAFSSNPEWNRYWQEQRLYLQSYHYLQPERYQTGTTICLPSLEEDFRSVHQIAREKFNIHYVIEVVSKSHQGIESFGFSTSWLDHTTISLFLTNLPCLKLFFRVFREKHGELFRQLKDCSFDLGLEIGPKFSQVTHIAPTLMLGSDFLKDIGVPIHAHLSEREREICSVITRGLSAREIGEDLELSKRTVESYIENIKTKLNCFTKAEMIQKCLDLEAIGYFG
jgi:DNA-binding CsgD family transcriptional regulator